MKRVIKKGIAILAGYYAIILSMMIEPSVILMTAYYLLMIEIGFITYLIFRKIFKI